MYESYTLVYQRLGREIKNDNNTITIHKNSTLYLFLIFMILCPTLMTQRIHSSVYLMQSIRRLTPMKMIIKDLSKAFDKVTVLNSINMEFEKGKIYALLGRNGCGKTTFFNCLSQDLTKDRGSVQFDDGTDIQPSDIGYVYTNPMLPEFLTGYEFLKFFLEINADRGFDVKDIDAHFETIQINKDDRDKLIKTYSHGMRNKLQMLCVIIQQPKILLLDEPLTSFDVVASIEMKQQLVALKENTIMILSTHILQIAKEICDEVVVLHHGSMELIDSTKLHNDDFETEILEILREDHEQ